MATLGLLSYVTAGLVFLILAALLTVSWKGRAIGIALIGACSASAAWAFVLAYYAATESTLGPIVLVAELVRDATWLIFLLALVRRRVAGWLFYAAHGVWIAAFVHILSIRLLYPNEEAVTTAVTLQFLLLAFLSLVLLEQIYRNLRVTRRAAVGYLCVGLGVVFTYDLALFAHGALLRTISEELWYARGVVNALAAPLIAVAARRMPDWSLDIFVSRKVVFYSTTFVASGIYLVAMALAGYYIQLYGGMWGAALMWTFVTAAALIFLTSLYSARVAGQWKVFLSKHFYRNKYEYRDEWLRVIRTLAQGAAEAPLRERVVRAIAQIVGASGGVLWRRNEDSHFAATAAWNAECPAGLVAADNSVVAFLAKRRWIMDTRELFQDPDHYGGVVLPEEFHGDARRLIVPLLQDESLCGVVVLIDPAPTFELTYEDYDLLKTVGQQVASHLAQEEAEERLAQSRQFEAYNQLASFIVHDVKNVIAQQSLLVRNAAKFRHDPAFFDDAIRTVENSVARMQHLLGQLARGGSVELRRVNLKQVLDDVMGQCKTRPPEPQLEATGDPLSVRADREQLTAILCHLVKNAQDATARDGTVRLTLSARDGRAVIHVTDTGSGMTPEFIRERLFKPFDSTKGTKGMGIGAYQAREFVRQAGGQLQVESAVGVGTTISVELPLDATAPALDGARAPTRAGLS